DRASGVAVRLHGGGVGRSARTSPRGEGCTGRAPRAGRLLPLLEPLPESRRGRAEDARTLARRPTLRRRAACRRGRTLGDQGAREPAARSLAARERPGTVVRAPWSGLTRLAPGFDGVGGQVPLKSG